MTININPYSYNFIDFTRYRSIKAYKSTGGY